MEQQINSAEIIAALDRTAWLKKETAQAQAEYAALSAKCTLYADPEGYIAAIPKPVVPDEAAYQKTLRRYAGYRASAALKGLLRAAIAIAVSAVLFGAALMIFRESIRDFLEAIEFFDEMETAAQNSLMRFLCAVPGIIVGIVLFFHEMGDCPSIKKLTDEHEIESAAHDEAMARYDAAVADYARDIPQMREHYSEYTARVAELKESLAPMQHELENLLEGYAAAYDTETLALLKSICERYHCDSLYGANGLNTRYQEYIDREALLNEVRTLVARFEMAEHNEGETTES